MNIKYAKEKSREKPKRQETEVVEEEVETETVAEAPVVNNRGPIGGEVVRTQVRITKKKKRPVVREVPSEEVNIADLPRPKRKRPQKTQRKQTQGKTQQQTQGKNQPQKQQQGKKKQQQKKQQPKKQQPKKQQPKKQQQQRKRPSTPHINPNTRTRDSFEIFARNPHTNETFRLASIDSNGPQITDESNFDRYLTRPFFG